MRPSSFKVRSYHADIDLVGSAVSHFAHFMHSGPSALGWVVTVFLVVPPVTLLHEAGHAAAARVRLPGRVRIRIGREPARPAFALAGVEVHVGSLAQPLGVTGVCEYEGRGATARDTAVVALAGPAASFLGFLCSLALLGHVQPNTFAHALVWQAAMVQGFSLVLTLVPMRVAERRGARSLPSDGAIVLDALRHGALGLQPGPALTTAPPRTEIAEPAHVPTAVASPLCHACGHGRDEHIDLETGRRGGCLGQDFDFQTLTATACACRAYMHAPWRAN